MEGWVNAGFLVDEVFEKIKIPDNALFVVRMLESTIVDTMNTYIGLFNKKHRTTVDTFEYLLQAMVVTIS